MKSHRTHRITFEENIKYGPIEKYLRFGLFPWKLTVRVLLILLTTMQVIFIVSEITSKNRAQERHIMNLFIEDNDKTDTDYARAVYLYSIPQIREHVLSSFRNFINIKKNSLYHVDYDNDMPYIEFDYINQHPGKEYSFTFDQSPFVKLNDQDLKVFLNDVINFRINYSLIINTCERWLITPIYDFKERVNFIVRLNTAYVPCQNTESSMENFIEKLQYINVLVLVFASISFIFTSNQINTLGKMYYNVRFKRKKVQSFDMTSSSESIYFNPLLDKEETTTTQSKKENLKVKPKRHLEVFLIWSLICLVGNLSQVLGSGLALTYVDTINTSISIMVGLGCFFAWLYIGRYIEYHGDYATIYETLQRSFPVVLRYLLGTLPIFLGFLFFGMCCFWQSERFASVSQAVISLFSMINGDIIFDVFHELKEINFFLGQAFCYFFCLIFITIVWNIFISIIEEAYVVTKIKNKTSWVLNYINLEPKLVEIKLHSKKSMDITRSYFKELEKSTSQSVKSLPAFENTSNLTYVDKIMAKSHRPSRFKKASKSYRSQRAESIKESDEDEDYDDLIYEGGRKNLSNQNKSYTTAQLPQVEIKDYHKQGGHVTFKEESFINQGKLMWQSDGKELDFFFKEIETSLDNSISILSTMPHQERENDQIESFVFKRVSKLIRDSNDLKLILSKEI